MRIVYISISYCLHILYIYTITDTSLTFTFPCFFRSCSWPKAIDIRGFTEELQHKTWSEVMALPSATSKAIQWEMDWFGDFFVPETMAFYHQHTGSSCKFSLNTNAMIQAKRWMGRVSAVMWTRDTSTRNLLDSAHASHCSSRLLFISHFRWINSCL